MSSSSSILSHVEFFSAITADYKAGQKVWRETSAEVYNAMMAVIPPVFWGYECFAVGEAYTHNAEGKPVFAYFVKDAGRYFGLYASLKEIKGKTLPRLEAR